MTFCFPAGCPQNEFGNVDTDMDHGKQKGNESTDITVKQTTLRTGGKKNKNKKTNTPGRWWRAMMEVQIKKQPVKGPTQRPMAPESII